MSLFSVSRLMNIRTRSSKRTPPAQQAAQDDDSQSQKRVVVDSTASPAITTKANSHPETVPKEQDFSFPPTPSRQSEVTKTHLQKTEVFEEPGYDVVLQPSAKASFGDWTELDAGRKASEPTAKAFDAESQFGIDKNAEEQSLAKASNDTNWTPLDIREKAEELPRKPSVPDWTHLEIGKNAEEPSTMPSDAEWLQLDIDKKIKEAVVQEERAAHLKELRLVTEEKQKLAERVKELEEELHQAEHELQQKTEQISQFIADFYRMENEIGALKEEKERIQQVAAREKEESLDEIRRSNEAIAARWQATKELKDAETVELMAKQDNMQEELDVMVRDLSKSQERVAELESANQSQAKELLEQDATLASHSDTIAALKGQKATLMTQVHTLRTNAKVNERQNSMLMIQLRQQSDDIVAQKQKGTIPSVTIAKTARHTTGATLFEQAVRTVKTLNEEIYQTAASLTDCVDEIEKRFVDDDDTAAALETLKLLLGTEIYTELDDERCMTNDYNPFVLLTGFQACLTACCMRIITSWYPAEPEYGKFLEAVYEKIRGSEGPENAAQWRKWTLRSKLSTDTGTKGVLLDFVTDNLYAILNMSGWPKSGKTANLLDIFNSKIAEIVNLAVRLNTLAAETTMPGDLIVTTVEEGKGYVSQEMADDTPVGGLENTYSEAPFSQVVFGCVALGLKWREGDMHEAQLVLKPRVILRKVYKFRSWA